EGSDAPITWQTLPATFPQAANVKLTRPDDPGVPSVFPGIQIANSDWPSNIPAGGNTFPFGMFARNGDILQVPFIGAYEIRDSKNANTDTHFVELNALPMDCSYVDDQQQNTTTNARFSDATGTADDTIEQLGRFCPLQ